MTAPGASTRRRPMALPDAPVQPPSSEAGPPPSGTSRRRPMALPGVSVHPSGTGAGAPVVRSSRRHTGQGTGPSALPVILIAAVSVTLVGLAVTVERYGYDVWGAFVWGPVLVLISVPLCGAVARRCGDPGVARFLVGAAVLKIVVGGVARSAGTALLYDGLGDAERYDTAATELASQFRALDFTGLGEISGTRFLEVVTGLVQAAIGDTLIGTFFVFSFFGFVGMLLLYLAFCEGVPDGDHRRFRLLLFLVPSMWFWPSSIGKEAFMLLCLGAVALGVSRLYRGAISGVVPLALGVWGVIVLRPHYALVALAALAVGVLAPAGRRTHGARGGGRRALLSRVAAPLALVIAVPFAVGAAERFFGIDNLDVDSTEEFFTDIDRRTSQGGSEFAAPDPNSPIGYPVAVVTGLFRPLPGEVSGASGAISSLEGASTLFITGRCLWRGRGHLRRAVRIRFALFSLAFVGVYCYVFASIENFGIIARQRSLVLPFLFVVLATITATTVTRPSTATADLAPEPAWRR